jgi:hypothetical protein
VSKKIIIVPFVFVLICTQILFCSNPSKINGIIISNNHLKEIKNNIRNYYWCSKYFNQLVQTSDSFLSSAICIPTRGGNWGSWYVSPKTGEKLITGKQIDSEKWEHLDREGNIFLGNDSIGQSDFDGVVIARIHENNILKLTLLGLSFSITHDTKYLKKSKEIINRYIEKYGTFPIHDIYFKENWKQTNTRGKVGSSSLDEAIWITKFATAISFVWENLSANEKKLVQYNIFDPAEKLIEKPYEGITNRSCWQSCALGMIYILTNRTNSLRELWDNEGSLYKIFNIGFKNNFWYENCVGYHFFALNPLLRISQASKLNGVSVPKRVSNFSTKFQIVNQMMRPDGLVTAINDANPFDISRLNANYSPGLFYFANEVDENHDLKLPYQIANDTSINLEGGLFKFLFYTEHNNVDQNIKTARINNVGGIDIWEKGDFWLAVKTDIRVGVHSHLDRLSFQLFYKNINVTEDLGILAAYGSKLHDSWFKNGQSHNSFDFGSVFDSEMPPKISSFKNDSFELVVEYYYYHPIKSAFLIRTFTLGQTTVTINDKILNIGSNKKNNFYIHFTSPLSPNDFSFWKDFSVKSNRFLSFNTIIKSSEVKQKFNFAIKSEFPILLNCNYQLDRDLNKILCFTGANFNKYNSITYKIQPIKRYDKL